MINTDRPEALTYCHLAKGLLGLRGNWDILPLKLSCRNWNKWVLKLGLSSWRRTIERRGKFQMITTSSWITSRHRRRSFPMKLALDARPLSTLRQGIWVCECAVSFQLTYSYDQRCNFISILRLRKQQPNSPHRCQDICVQIDPLCHCKHDTHRIGDVNFNGLDGYCCLLWRLGRKETPEHGKTLWWLRSIDLRQGIFSRINVMEGGLDKGP